MSVLISYAVDRISDSVAQIATAIDRIAAAVDRFTDAYTRAHDPEAVVTPEAWDQAKWKWNRVDRGPRFHQLPAEMQIALARRQAAKAARAAAIGGDL